MNAKPNIMAIGNRWASAYTSQIHELQKFANLEFHDEKKFKNVDHVISFYNSENFDAILMPNPYGNPRRMYVYQKCREIGVKTIVFDRGGLPNSWFFDQGFNADSPTYEHENWDQELNKSDKLETEKYVKDFIKSDKSLEDQSARQSIRSLRDQYNLGKSKVLFVAFQRPSDTTMKFFSGNVTDIHDFVKKIKDIQHLIKVRKLDWKIICKKHPLEVEKPSKALNFVDDSTHINDLLQLSDAVCLVNSGVGLIASIFEKKVYHFGKTYYSHPNINKQVKTAEEIVDDFERPLHDDFKETRNRLIYYLRKKVYSEVEFKNEKVLEKDGAYRTIARHLKFINTNFPTIEKKVKVVRKRVLFVTPVIPIPVNRGSAQRTDQIIRSLKKNGLQVDIVLVNRSEKHSKSEELIERLENGYPGSKVYVRKHPEYASPGSKIEAYHKMLKYLDLALLNNYKIRNENENPVVFQNYVKELLESEKYDYMYVNYLKMVPKSLNTDIEVICDIHDLQINRIKNDVSHNWNSLFRPFLEWVFKASELNLLRKCHKIVSISSVESKVIKKVIPKAEIHDIPVTFDLRKQDDELKISNYAFDFIFVGSNSDANADSILWFVEYIWPNLKEANEDLTLLIQGAITRNKTLIQLLESDPKYYSGVTIRKFIENLANAYNNSKVVIAPTTKGTGMKVKVIEALSYAKPVVGTDIAFEGINIKHGHNAVVANTKEEFIAECLKVVNSDGKALDISKNVYNLFKSEYSFETAIRKTSKLFK